MNIVKELIKKAGTTQKELAISIGVSKPTVSEWASNKKDPSGVNLKKLAKYFDVDELIILGKGVIDLTKPEPQAPRTPEARIVSFGMDQLPQIERDKILFALRTMYANQPDLFKRGDNADET